MVRCVHVSKSNIQPPAPSQVVYRDDCTQCFDSVDDPAGLNVCLQCFNGGCAGDRKHANLHYLRIGHPLALNIKRSLKKHVEPPAKMSKLAIQAESEDDRYDTTTTVVCFECQLEEVEKEVHHLRPVIDRILKSLSFSKKEEIKAWEQEFMPCEHTLCLEQEENKNIDPSGLLHCSMCRLDANLWLCLECGNVGCGRSQFGGVGGNSHALEHADKSHHGVVVKLGSITAEGSADIYCYTCNEERVDPALTEHLAHWGINVAEREKTEQSLMEMQIEQNLRWEFTMKNEDGEDLEPLFGPGLTGLKNLGNSCYLSSVIQCLFSLEEFKKRYQQDIENPPVTPTPAEDFETQMQKLADGIWSGRYSTPRTEAYSMPDSSSLPHQRGLAPAMFKHLVGRGHSEFSTMRQQDAFEFLQHLFKIISLSKHSDQLANPVSSFRFAVEQRLQCIACKRVRYSLDEQDNVSIPVPARQIERHHIGRSDTSKALYEKVTLSQCFDSFTSEETVELTCPACGSTDGFRKRSLFKSLPCQLIVNARRFELINWVPTKLDIPVEVGNDTLELTGFLAPEHPPQEQLLPDEPRFHTGPSLDQSLLNQLMEMGFSQARCETALQATPNADLESAMNWLLEHIDDPEPPVLPRISSPSYSAGVDMEKIQQLQEMGIGESQACKALAATDGDVDRALDWVFSHPDIVDDQTPTGMPLSAGNHSHTVPGISDTPAKYKLHAIVCHKGGSVHAGHYVAFIRKEISGQTAWVLFNDEKVVKADQVEEMKLYAYVYFFTRLV